LQTGVYMRSCIPVILIWFLFLAGCGEPPEENNPNRQEQIPWPSLADSPWPMYRHDPQGTNRSQFSGPSIGSVSIVIGDSLWFDGSISIDEQNNLLVTTSGNTLSDLVIFNTAGVTILNHRLVSGRTDENPCTPTISSEGRIYVTSISASDSKVQAIDFQGNVVWEYQVNGFVSQSVMLDMEGNLYFLTQNSRELISLTPDGVFRWSLTVPDKFHNLTYPGVFAPDGSQLYVPATENLYAVSTEGAIIWSYEVAPWVSFTMVDNDGNLYFYNPGDSSFTALTSGGGLIWRRPIADFNLRRIGLWYAPTIDVYGNLYFSVENQEGIRQLISLNSADGSLRWTLDIHCNDLVSDSEGRIYCAGDQTTFESDAPFDYKAWCVSSEGEVVWEVDMPIIAGGFFYEPPAIGSNNICYFPVEAYNASLIVGVK